MIIDCDNKINYKSRTQLENKISFSFVSCASEEEEKMARLEIFVVGLILAITLNFVACSSESKIEVSVVPDMAKYLKENPDIKVQPLIKHTNEALPYGGIKYTLGKRIAGKVLEFSERS